MVTLRNFETIAKRKINKRTSDLNQVAHLFEKKFKAMCGKKDASYFWAGLKITPHKKTYMQYFWIAILIFARLLIFYLKSDDRLKSTGGF